MSLAVLITRRLALGVLILLFVSVLVFAGTEVLPGDVAQAILGQGATAEIIANVRARLGLDVPAHLRYFTWLGNLLAGNRGTSLANNADIADMVGERIGSATGFLAAVRGGWVDAVLSRIVDALISFPAIMIALIVISGLGSTFAVLIVTVALIDATRVFRVARALGMDIVVQDYIEAARARGEKLGWIMWHELLPNALAPLAAEFGIRFTYAILFISTLSFLGLGVQPRHADLGVMVKENMQGLLYGSYAPIFPALCIALVTVSVNMLVDWFLKTTDAALPDEL